MTNKKDKTNWFYLALGLCFLILGLFITSNKKEVDESSLVTQTIILSQDIQEIKYPKSQYNFILNSIEYKCSFIIETGAMAANWKHLDDILKNDTLVIKIHSSKLAALNNKLEKIPIYSLQKNDSIIYSVDNYNNSIKTFNKRWGTISIVMGILFLLRGFAIISSMFANILAVMSIVIIITARVLNIW